MITKKMKAIEYNLWMTLLKLLQDRLPSVLPGYGFGNVTIPVLPAYPRDLTNMSKPSIIVRKVGTSQYKVSINNHIGQYYDNDTNTYYDVNGIGHDSTIQIDILADSNVHSSLLISVISEDIFNAILLDDADRGRFTLYDFTTDTNNPIPIGTVTIVGTSDISGLSVSDKNNDYVSIIRYRFDIIQTVVPKQEFVDLSKWIKQTQTIHVKGGIQHGK